MVNDTEERFYTIYEASEIFSLSPQTIRKLIKSGQIKAIKLGHSYRIPYTSIYQLSLQHIFNPKD